MNGPGYVAVITGEVARIIKCIPVQVTLRRTDACYIELPVTRRNDTLFLTPKTHLLVRKGTEIPCDGAIPTTYRIGEDWYELTPKPTKTTKPNILQPVQKDTWKYEDPGDLANIGIYTAEELENLQERIMFPMEQPAVINAITRTMAGQKVSYQGMSIANLIDEQTIESVARTTWGKLWERFMVFGTAISGAIGAYMIFQMFKIILKIILQGITIHNVYGCTFHLLGACCSCITHYLISRKVKDLFNDPDASMELIPQPKPAPALESIVTQPTPSPRDPESKPNFFSVN